ncbi:putative R3H and G-patch domain protein [Aspergillus vadensis CBS 113365]|uniref:Protein SQS1 n=1 Tax=Aspergillus vadensis (strain CBS 113365 / IMI 142717 / IBT 24658) TaxID=1448311 RepID=A0A319BD34_ASPVC|nr:R3H and G-patch domain protein [Aspergillus vadensis CBS 113365]PYH63933.1 R3H and G-patch domain protein [Aspergillus vadensis CBS 113365]
MQQEARNTEGRSLWRTGASLRHQTVRFVSARDIDRESETQPSPSTIEITAREESLETRTTQNCDQATATSLSERRPGPEDSPLCVELLDNFESTVISDSMEHSSKQSHDDSSEDEVVFRGRRHQYGEGRSHPSDIRTQVISSSQQPRTSEHSKLGSLSSNSEPRSLPAPKPLQTETCPQEMDDSPNYFSLTSDKRRRKKWKRDDDDILADYIDNIDTEYSILGILGSPPHPDEAQESDNADKVAPTSAMGLNSAAEKELRRNEASAQHVNLTPSDEQECGENDNSECHYNHLDEEISQEVSVNRISHTDIASTSSSDGSDTEDIEEDKSENLHAYDNGFFASATAFADALEFDPYYGFDIMDFNRPSVKKKSKGKGRSLDINLSDSELESELVNAWQNDRAKKKARKQKREELRSQGLLGRGRQNPSLKDKYSNGIGTEDLRSEIRHFLLSSRNSLALPPMSKQHRKLVHELANVLSMKSQSRGNGSSRFPIVHKTSRTPAYSSKTVSQMDRILSNGRGQRGLKFRDSKPSKPSKSRRGRTDATVSYMDGDVVGGSAPEIGAENKGRAMLEKMGWSIGTPLGSMNNKGILLPVAHVVKNSRAGLG